MLSLVSARAVGRQVAIVSACGVRWFARATHEDDAKSIADEFNAEMSLLFGGMDDVHGAARAHNDFFTQHAALADDRPQHAQPHDVTPVAAATSRLQDTAKPSRHEEGPVVIHHHYHYHYHQAGSGEAGKAGAAVHSPANTSPMVITVHHHHHYYGCAPPVPSDDKVRMA